VFSVLSPNSIIAHDHDVRKLRFREHALACFVLFLYLSLYGSKNCNSSIAKIAIADRKSIAKIAIAIISIAKIAIDVGV
jgi:hypothetical protein